MQPQLIIFICLFTTGQCLLSKIFSQEQEDDNKVITIDQDGTSDLQCCMYGKCLCSNISHSLEHLQDDTEIRIQSDISLHNIAVFGNVSNVKLAGDSNPTVRCDHQGGLVGKSIEYIVIQGITWDSCNGITILNFSGVHIVEGAFVSSIHFALALHGLGSVNINGCIFSHNNGSIDVLASSVYIYGSEFYADRKIAILVNTMNDDNTLSLHNILSNVTIEYCGFSDISEHCIESAGLMKNLTIHSTNFTNNTNAAVNVEHCNVTLNNVTFYNNVNVNSGYINDGGAVRVNNGTLYMTGEVLFSYNRASSKGGAIYLNHSVMFASQGSFLFHNNTADYGGAVYIGQGSRLNTILNKASLIFLQNRALFNGGAVYVDLHHINDVAITRQLHSYYYDMLTNSCKFSNSAVLGNCAYFNVLSTYSPTVNHHDYNPNVIVSSSFCLIDSYENSLVYVNATNISEGSLSFWSHDLHLAVFTVDCPSPISASFNCCDSIDGSSYNCTIGSQTGSFTVTSKNSVIECPNSNTITCNVFVNGSNTKIYVTVQRFGHICDDIAHVNAEGVCLPVCSPIDPQEASVTCWPQTIHPGFWYDNGFERFVTSCPVSHFDKTFHLEGILYDFSAQFPNRDLQCNAHWGGLACGECNYSAGYAIKYDTSECVPVDECLTTSVTYSLLILFGVSFFYWIVVISFIFVLLHFKFDITAGCAYGLLFYYSVLEQIVNDVTDHLDISLESSYGFNVYNSFNAYGDVNDAYDIDGDYDWMRLKVLPFLSSIGNLKPPFAGSINLCLGEAEMIDHLILEYIHPLIVTFLVVIIYVLARNFVLVAGTVGRYINSKSICILLLLSYNSITYTSMQLLKPLPVFCGQYSYGMNSEMQLYWSPSMKYFHNRHALYGMIALFCELIVGIGLPLFLVFQKCLIRYCNINFTSMKHVTDQLMGCYKKEYRWFAVYYLVCRQILYGINNLIDYCSGFWTTNEETFATPFPKFTIIIIICILIMAIHAMFQPYKTKGLNILDTFILLSLVGLLLSGLEIYWNRMISVIFWFLPLLILINYLAKLKYSIPLSCIALFIATFYLAAYSISPTSIHFVFGVFSGLFLGSSLVVFIAYIIYLLKCLYTRCCRGRPRYLAINEQNDEVNDSNDSNIAEVCK